MGRLDRCDLPKPGLIKKPEYSLRALRDARMIDAKQRLG